MRVLCLLIDYVVCIHLFSRVCSVSCRLAINYLTCAAVGEVVSGSLMEHMVQSLAVQAIKSSKNTPLQFRLTVTGTFKCLQQWKGMRMMARNRKGFGSVFANLHRYSGVLYKNAIH